MPGERIKKTPIKEALKKLDIAWDHVAARLEALSPDDVMRDMLNAVYHNGSHPFRDKLHIEGMQKGLQFALTGRNEAVEYWLQKADNISQNPDANRIERRQQVPPSGLQVLLVCVLAGVPVRDLVGVVRKIYPFRETRR